MALLGPLVAACVVAPTWVPENAGCEFNAPEPQTVFAVVTGTVVRTSRWTRGDIVSTCGEDLIVANSCGWYRSEVRVLETHQPPLRGDDHRFELSRGADSLKHRVLEVTRVN